MPEHRPSSNLGLLFIGVFLCGIALIARSATGKVFLIAAIIGPMTIVMYFTMMMVPIEKLYYPCGVVDGKPVYDTRSTDCTPLMWIIVAVGILIGAAYAYCIWSGLI